MFFMVFRIWWWVEVICFGFMFFNCWILGIGVFGLRVFLDCNIMCSIMFGVFSV